MTSLSTCLPIGLQSTFSLVVLGLTCSVLSRRVQPTSQMIGSQDALFISLYINAPTQPFCHGQLIAELIAVHHLVGEYFHYRPHQRHIVFHHYLVCTTPTHLFHFQPIYPCSLALSALLELSVLGLGLSLPCSREASHSSSRGLSKVRSPRAKADSGA